MPSAEFEAVLAGLRAAPPAIPADVHGARAALDELMGAAPLADGIAVEPVTAGGRPAEWLRPAHATRDGPALLYLHGGAFRIGSLRAYRPFASQLAAAFGWPLLVLDYRLAPEHPFPAAVEDAVAAYRELLDGDHAASRIALAGDSAGGGLVVSTLVAARDRGLPQPGAAVSLSPLADLTLSGASWATNATRDPYVSLEMAKQAVADYLGEADPRHPLASPVFADLSGLAPILVHASDAEVLADDARALAGAVEASGGDVELGLWPEMTHVWHAMTPAVPEASDAVDQIGAFLRARISP